MTNLINRIERLEEKQFKGLATMDEDVVLLKLIELAEGFLKR